MKATPTSSAAKLSFLVILLSCLAAAVIGLYAFGLPLSAPVFASLPALFRLGDFILLVLLAAIVSARWLAHSVATREFPMANKIFAGLRWLCFIVLVTIAVASPFLSGNSILSVFSNPISALAYSTLEATAAVWICPLGPAVSLKRAISLGLLGVSIFPFVFTWDVLTIIPILMNYMILDFFTHHWDLELWPPFKHVA